MSINAVREKTAENEFLPAHSEGWAERLKVQVIKIKRIVVEIFQNLLIAIPFTLSVLGVAVLRGNMFLATLPIVGITALISSLGPAFRSKILKAAAFALLFIERLQGPNMYSILGKTPAGEKRASREEISHIVKELEKIGAFFPQNPQSLPPEVLEEINKKSCLQYETVDGELQVRILPKAATAGNPVLNESQVLNSVKALCFKYPNIKRLYLPKIQNICAFTDILEKMQSDKSAGLSFLGLEDMTLNENSIRYIFSQLDLHILTLRRCVLKDSVSSSQDLWSMVSGKTLVYVYNGKGELIDSNQEMMQKSFEAALTDKIMSGNWPEKTKDERIETFIKKLPQPSRGGYYALCLQGVNLDLGWFDQLNDYQKRAEKFLLDFHQAGYKIHQLTSPFTLDGNILSKLAGQPLKCLKTVGLSEVKSLKFLPHLEELHLNYEGNITDLLSALPEHVTKVVLRRKTSSNLPAEPYMELVKEGNAYAVKMYSAARDSLSDDLDKLQRAEIKIGEIDFSALGGLKNKKQELQRIVNFCLLKQVARLSLAGCGLEAQDLEQGLYKRPKDEFLKLFCPDPNTGYEGLKFLDLSSNPSITDIFPRWHPESFLRLEIKLNDLIKEK